MKILADATLPGLLEAFPSPFHLTLYNNVDELAALLPNQDILLCRSTLKVNRDLLNDSSLTFVATASSGTDHIDKNYLNTRGIRLIDAKGSNAAAVADYVIASLAFLQKYHQFHGTRAAIIGVGEIGTEVGKRLQATNMAVIGYDPPKSLRDEKFSSSSLEEVATCDLICIHADLHSTPPYPSVNLINDALLKQLHPGCAIINASRGGLVDETALFNQKPDLFYCTDVFSREPYINREIVNMATLCTPHIAGHSIEAKYAAVTMISAELHRSYQLPPPLFAVPEVQVPVIKMQKQWQDDVLSFYNPVHETQVLKNSDDLKSTFLRLRKAHQSRHNFSVYANHLNSSSSQLLQLLGIKEE
ncbi:MULTISPECIES: 4-phosphoerythronate dehydrogenase [unclassified Legionella]|uniref:4-phosphoerythronate dehydrogenase n=1 Tax=unclassified Legionella TaxID=2622702 RepID=UPI00105661D7|nr:MULTISPECIES: 4-phosphoerythronate dehydrogenase [unclassified Legionella]MDI9817684.1 4-phosphoerythronate dehydrogenase [Legionella sp. PL877]